MTSAAKKLLEEALALPSEDRAKLVDALADSLDAAEAGLSPAWKVEIERRVGAVERGESRLIPGDEVDARRQASLGRGCVSSSRRRRSTSPRRLRSTTSSSVRATARTGASTLRAKAVVVLGRMRAEITDNLDEDPKLPPDLVAKVFGYFDTLDAMNPGSGAAKAPPPAPPAPVM